MNFRNYIGSVSSGTLQPRDLLPTFTDTLEQCARHQHCLKQHRALIKEARAVDTESENALDVMADLQDALDALAPPYFYFGAHPGDGADFGFWLSDSLDKDFDGLRVSDTSEVPHGYTGEVLHVNDHGNATLYRAVRGRLYEIWAVV